MCPFFVSDCVLSCGVVWSLALSYTKSLQYCIVLHRTFFLLLNKYFMKIFLHIFCTIFTHWCLFCAFLCVSNGLHTCWVLCMCVSLCVWVSVCCVRLSVGLSVCLVSICISLNACLCVCLSVCLSCFYVFGSPSATSYINKTIDAASNFYIFVYSCFCVYCLRACFQI